MTFTTKIEHSIGYITINKPPMNALNSNDWLSFYKLFEEQAFNDEIKAIIIDSHGKGFCSGTDSNEHKDLAFEKKVKVYEKINGGVWKLVQAIERSQVPVIVCCSNFVVGAGMLIAMSADFIFAESKTQFKFPGIKLGVFAGISNALSLLPKPLAKKMLYTGEPIFAEELFKYGVITEICSNKEALSKESIELAKKITSHKREHLIMMKSLILENKNHSSSLKNELSASINLLKSLD